MDAMQQPPPEKPRSILFATDLSARSDRALDRAAQLSLRWGAQLVALHALAPESELRSFHEEHELHSWQRPADPLAVAERQLRASLLQGPEHVTTLVEEGDPAEVIARVAEERGCGLIVTGAARDESLGRLFVGATVEKLVRRSSVPVLTVKLRVRAPYRTIVVATDFSDSSRRALEGAAGWFDQGALTLFNAYQVPLSGLAADAQQYRDEYRAVVAGQSASFLAAAQIPAALRPHVGTVIEYGEPQHLLAEYAGDKSVDLVVAGTRGRGAISTMLLGSVAAELLSAVPCDILVVREPPEEADSPAP
jgi:nucleotide-binding universal stress UspA family protein